MRDKLIILVFLTFISFFGVGYLFFGQRDFSELENRVLQKAPTPTFSSVINGEFTAQFEDYASDQILFKDWFVKEDVLFKRVTGQSLINGVYDGTEGYLFQDFQQPGEQLYSNLSDIDDFVKANPDSDITVFVIPNANDIYTEYMPVNACTYPQDKVIEQVYDALADDCRVLDARETLMDHKEEGVFFRNDHHFNGLGAYYAYSKLCIGMGVEPRPQNTYEVRTFDREFYGSLYSKLPLATQTGDEFWFYWNPDAAYDVEYVADGVTKHTLYDEDYATKKDLYSIYFGGNHPLVKIRQRGENMANKPLGKVLVIKDSYANSLVPLLMDECSGIDMIDLRYFHEDVTEYVHENSFDHVIFIHNVDYLSTDQNFLWL